MWFPRAGPPRSRGIRRDQADDKMECPVREFTAEVAGPCRVGGLVGPAAEQFARAFRIGQVRAPPAHCGFSERQARKPGGSRQAVLPDIGQQPQQFAALGRRLANGDHHRNEHHDSEERREHQRRHDLRMPGRQAPDEPAIGRPRRERRHHRPADRVQEIARHPQREERQEQRKRQPRREASFRPGRKRRSRILLRSCCHARQADPSSGINSPKLRRVSCRLVLLGLPVADQAVAA